MADTTLNITVTTEDASLLALIAKLNAGNLSVAEYNKTIRELRNASIVGSQAQKDLKEVISQVSDQTLSTNGQIMKSYFSVGEALRVQKAGELGLTDAIKSARQERRMYTFAIREGMDAISSITGTNNIMVQSVTQSTSAVFGVKFAMDALGGGIAKISLPIALFIGAVALLKNLFTDSKAQTDKETEALKKQREEYEKTATDIKNLSAELDHLFPGDKRVIDIKIQLRKDFAVQLKEIDDKIQAEAEKNGTALSILGQQTEYGRLQQQRADLLKFQDDQNKKIYEQGELIKQVVLFAKVGAPVQMARLLGTMSKAEVDGLTTSLQTLRDATVQGTTSWNLYNNALVLIQRGSSNAKDRLDAYAKALENRGAEEELQGERDIRIIQTILKNEQELDEYRKRSARNITIGGVRITQGGTSDEDFARRQQVVLEVLESKTQRAADKMAMLTQPIAQGFNNVGNAIQSGIIDKLHMGNTLLAQFLSGLLSGIVQLGLNFLTGGIFGALGLGGGSVLSGVGRYSGFPMGSVVGGGAGRVPIQTITQNTISQMTRMVSSSGGSSAGTSIIHIHNHYDAKGISTYVEKGNRLNAQIRS